MRIRIVQKPDVLYVDGVRLSGFEWGIQYDVNAALGTYMIAQGWADSVIDGDAATSPEATADDQNTPVNLKRESFPPYYDSPLGLALDRRRRPR